MKRIRIAAEWALGSLGMWNDIRNESRGRLAGSAAKWRDSPSQDVVNFAASVVAFKLCSLAIYSRY